MKIQALRTYLVAVQLCVVSLHDLVDVPGWTHGSQVASLIGRRRLWLATLINATFPSLAVGLAIAFSNQPAPPSVLNYWLAYCAVTCALAISMWYVPYLFGTTEKRRRECASMYERTKQVLPARGDNPRPNLLHVCFHVLFVVHGTLACILRSGG